MKLIYVAGKGGVGKSVCSASTGLWAAKSGIETLVFSMDPAHSLSDILEVEIGSRPSKIGDHLHCYEPSIEDEARVFFSRYRNMLSGIFGLFEMEIKPDDLGSLPGVSELVFMDKLCDIYKEDMYDLVVIDSAPTAMVLPLLQLPSATTGFFTKMLGIKSRWMGLLNMLEPGFGDSMVHEVRNLRSKAETMRNALLDKDTAVLTVVTIPEKAAIMETVRLIDTVESHDVAVDSVIINHVMNGGCECDYCRRRRDSQQFYMSSIRRMYGGKRIAELQDYGGEVKGDLLNVVGEALYGKGQLGI
jgi:arsenite-transporting ATPase